MILQDLIQKIEEKFPTHLAYDWDNVGLLAGDPRAEIRRVFVTLDVNSAIAEEAKNAGADLILSHHPILMQGVKTVREDTEDGKMLSILFKNNIAVYAAHTNLDTASTGINARLAELFALSDVEVLADEVAADTGLGRIGNLPEEMTLAEFSALCKTKLKTPALRVSGDLEKKIRRVAIGSGGCGEYIPTAQKKGADVMLTADLKYHPAIDAVLSGIAVVDAGHYPTEIMAMDIFADCLFDCGVEIVRSQNTDIFQYV